MESKAILESPNGGDPSAIARDEEWVIAPSDGEVTLVILWKDNTEQREEVDKLSVILSPNVDRVDLDIATWENTGVFYNGGEVREHFL